MQTDLPQRLESVVRRVNPGVRFDQSLFKQLDSLQVAFLLDEIEKEFAISFPSAELIFMPQLNLEALVRAISQRLC